MEALKLQTIADLLVHPDERVELIGGEIVRRPMARFAHGRAQMRTARRLGHFEDGPQGGDGWWLATEVSPTFSATTSHRLRGQAAFLACWCIRSMRNSGARSAPPSHATVRMTGCR